MLKKIFALSLSLCMIAIAVVTAPVMSVSAAYTNRWTDNFEEGKEAYTSKLGYYYASPTTEAGDGVLVAPKHVLWGNHLTVADSVGYGETRGLRMHCDTTQSGTSGLYQGAWIMTRGVTLTDADESAGTKTNSVVLRYKIRFPYDAPKGGSNYIWLSSMLTTESTFSNNRSVYAYSSSSAFTAGEWYTVVTKVTGAGTTKTVNSYILDEDNNIHLSQNKTITVATADAPLYLSPVYLVAKSVAVDSKMELVVDDVSLTEYTASAQNISLDASESSIADDATGVGIGESFRLTFDQELAAAAADTVKLYKKGDAANPVKVTVSDKTFDGFTVKPNTNLDLNTEYVLDFSGVTNSAGVALTGAGTIGFTTYDPSVAPIEPVNFVSASIADGKTGVGLQEAVTVNFDREILSPEAGTDVKLYETADAAQTAIGATVALTADSKGFTVTPSAKLSLGTNYTLSFSGVKSTLYGELAEDTTKSLTFTTIESREAIFVEDDLEGATESGYVSSVLNKTASGAYTVEEGSGYESSYGVRTKSATVQSLAYDLDDSETLFFEFKINIGEVTGDGAYMGVNGAAYSRCIFRIQDDGQGEYYLANAGLGSKYYYAPNEWYTMVWKVTNSEQKGYLFNDSGEMVFEISQNIAAEHMTGTAYFAIGKITGSTYDIKLDNFKVYRVQKDNLALDGEKSSVYNGASDFMPGRSITLAFNQPLSVRSAEAEGAVKLYNGSTELDAAVTRTGGNEIKIVPAAKLEDGTEYSVKFNGLAALSGNEIAVSDISFSTKEIYQIKTTGTTIPLSDGNVAAGDYTVSFKNADESVNGVLVAAIYTDNRLSELKALEILGSQTIEAGTSTADVTLKESYQGVGRVELLLYDNIDDVTPLMHAYRITE